MKKLFLSLLIIFIFLLTGCNNDGLLKGKHYVEISVKDYGKIKLELDADVAPITATNFIKLAKEKFYDGLTFHRIMYGFVIQGGDPKGDGTGGSEEKIIGEFKENGYENNISHVRGVISMARASYSMDSASSQFFIVHQDATASLDGKYAAFGHVISGMAVVDRIAMVVPLDYKTGLVAKENQPVIEYIKVVSK